MIQLGFSIRAISDPERLCEMEKEWDSFVNQWGEGNPFLLNRLIKEYARFSQVKGWNPLVLIVLVDNSIAGIAPFAVKTQFGIQSAKLLFDPHFLPEIVVDHRHREMCVSGILDYLAFTRKCGFIDMTLSTTSQNLKTLKEMCKTKGLYLGTKSEEGHRILSINSTWEEFRKARGANFRNKIKKIENHLTRAGPWEIRHFESGNDPSDIFAKILDVDKVSWKETWHSSSGVTVDKELLMILKCLRKAIGTQPDFTWHVSFLEMNNQTVAYTLVLQQKDTALIKRTSYDQRYKNLYPGILILNATISELFGRDQVKRIDFCTDHSFMATWTKNCVPRTTVMIRRGILPTMEGIVVENSFTRRILHSGLTGLMKKTGWQAPPLSRAFAGKTA